MSGSVGDARIERAPSARGPNSMRPWNQPITRFAASSAAARGDVGQPPVRQLGVLQERLDRVVTV